MQIGVVVSRLKTTTQKLSSCIPLRVLLPAVNKTYETLLNKKTYHCIPSLMSVLAESFDNVQPAELKTHINNLGEFFLQVLQFREDVENDIGNDESDMLKVVVAVEESASEALVTLVLKLSEATFKPLYEKLYNWATSSPQHKQRNITFYRYEQSGNYRGIVVSTRFLFLFQPVYLI